MHNNPYFFAGQERELSDLIDRFANHDLDHAACADTDPGAYHPEQGHPDELALLRCNGCSVRLTCLALALRAEDPDVREGWYGGLSPADRDDVAVTLQIEAISTHTPARAIEAARLRAGGWTVNAIAAELACSRRTVQRYFRVATRETSSRSCTPRAQGAATGIAMTTAMASASVCSCSDSPASSPRRRPPSSYLQPGCSSAGPGSLGCSS
ncbi:WhiB family transcriptional regulator [Micromonospora zamorensis]|uniref:WhiB family transcriptional regulator n=1 Tax=Micromonospora zamorensis TaxID=709883 RepID=UPI0039A450EC